jgi:hypothetical protein
VAEKAFSILLSSVVTALSQASSSAVMGGTVVVVAASVVVVAACEAPVDGASFPAHPPASRTSRTRTARRAAEPPRLRSARARGAGTSPTGSTLLAQAPSPAA